MSALETVSEARKPAPSAVLFGVYAGSAGAVGGAAIAGPKGAIVGGLLGAVLGAWVGYELAQPLWAPGELYR